MDIQPAAGRVTKRRLHPNLRIDMTPMVDLGFLLITFFIFTTTMSEKKSAALIMPREGGEAMPLAQSKALTVVLGSNEQVFAYAGKWEDAVRANSVVRTSYNEQEGIGKLIREKQKLLQTTQGQKGRDDLMLLIKPTTQSSYKNLIAALDETTINAVKKYAIVDASTEERSYSDNLTSSDKQ